MSNISCRWIAVLLLLLPLPPLSHGDRRITVSPSNPRQLSNSRLQFTASLDGEIIEGRVAWSSSDPAVATVSGRNGRATASLLTAGATTITAIFGGQRASTTLTVTVAVSPVFTIQPADTNVSAAIDAPAGVKVQLRDNLGDPLPGQSVSIAIGNNPPGTGTLTGTLTRTTNVSGIATFSDLKIDWLGTGYTLRASATPSSGPVISTSGPFNELRVGDACLGPDMPACSSGCADGDLDGLNDAWELAGGVDINGDGRITDSIHDVLLPGANSNAPDIFLKYDYMVAATHSHRPPDNAFVQMTAMFAAHGITLHVLAPMAGIPEHQVTTLDPNAQSSCAGDDFITVQQLRAQYLNQLQPAYHYMVFAHDSTTPNDGSLVHNCPADALCAAQPFPGALGIADVFGDDSIISDGYFFDHSLAAISIELRSSVMMHELGHNFGLAHGSLADSGNIIQEYCTNNAPNYIGVMNYLYEQGTLVPAVAPGSTIPISCSTDADCGPPAITAGRCATPNSCFCTDDIPQGNVCYRPDYAEDQLLNLNEATLDENVGVGGPSTLEDIVWYFVASGGTAAGPSNGSPIDWNVDGSISNLTGCTWGIDPTCPDINNNLIHSDQIDTTPDWTEVNGQLIHFNFQFQCTPGYSAGSRSSQLRRVFKVPRGWPTQFVAQP